MYSLLDTFCHALMTPTDSVWFKCNNIRMRLYTLIRICVFRLLLFDRQAFILFLSYSRTEWNNEFFYFISFLSSSFDCIFFLPRTVFFLDFPYQFSNRKYSDYALFDRHLCLSLQFLSYLTLHENPFYGIYSLPNKQFMI